MIQFLAHPVYNIFELWEVEQVMQRSCDIKVSNIKTAIKCIRNAAAAGGGW